MFIKKIISTVSLLALVMVFGVGEVQALTSAGNLQISGQVVGVKPVVTNLSVSTGVNTGATATVITGLNFTGAIYVTLDDSESTILTGMTVDSATQISATVPAGVSAGIYNVHVTTPNGTNISSDVKFTVTEPAPAASAAIVSVSPSGTPVGWTQAFTVTVSHLNDAQVYWTTDLTVPANSSMTPASDTVTGVTPSGADHEGTFDSTFAATAAGAYKVAFNVDDDSAMGGPDDTKTITIYAISW